MEKTCKVMKNTKSMVKEEWLRTRKLGIGGSDCAAICGESSYKGPLQVWLDKTTDEINDNPSEAAYWGNLMEDIVAKEFERRSGLKTRRRHAIYQSVEHPFMIANIDRDIVGEDAFLECVTTSIFQEKEWKDGNVPREQMLQVQHYMAVLGYDHCYIAALIGNKDFVIVRVERDQEMISYIIRLEEKFWNEHVLAKVSPELDGSVFSVDFVDNKFPTAEKGKEMKLSDKFLILLEKREELSEHIKVLENEKTAIDNNIKNEMGDHEKAKCGKYSIRWNNVSRKVVDKDKIAPEVYDSLCKITTYRSFVVK